MLFHQNKDNSVSNSDEGFATTSSIILKVNQKSKSIHIKQISVGYL